MAKVKRFEHYGVEVSLQELDELAQPFTSFLDKKEVEWSSIKKISDNIEVIVYCVDKELKYAIIKIVGGPDYECQKVYITKQIPVDDNWDRLIRDCDNQDAGEEPMEWQDVFEMMVESKVPYTYEDFVDEFMVDTKEIPLKEWAAAVGLDESYARQKARRGSLKTAHKIGRDWFISADEQNVDNRKKQ